MGIEVRYNRRQMEAQLFQVGERAEQRVTRVLRKAAIQIRDLARDYAPVKTGLLEQSIDYMVVRDSNRRNSFIVFIDMDAYKVVGVRKPRVVKLGDYAMKQHTMLRPYGSGELRLGRRSAAKRASGKKVGGRFLIRALDDSLAEVRAMVETEIRKIRL